jgi:hypothetical protein
MFSDWHNLDLTFAGHILLLPDKFKVFKLQWSFLFFGE